MATAARRLDDGPEVARSAVDPPVGRARRGRPTRAEWLTVAVVVLASAAFQVLGSVGMWFSSDFWGLVTERAPAPLGWFEPHAGHLAVFHAAAAGLVTAATGLESAWPGFALVRALGWVGLCTTLWWTWRRRGADPRVAMAALGVLAFYGGSGWIRGWLVGAPIAVAAGALACWLVADRARPSARDRVALGILLAVAAVATSGGLMGAAAVTVAVALTGRLRAWWPSVVAAGGLYAGWRLAVAPWSREIALEPAALAGLPWTAVQMAHAGYTRLLTGPEALGWVAAAAVLALLVVLLVRRRLSVFELAVVAWMGLYVAATGLTRIAAGQSAVTTVRYGYALVLLTTLLVVPHVRLPRGRVATALLAVATSVLVARNAWVLVQGPEGLAWFVERSTASRATVETAASLVADGEPALAFSPIDWPRAGLLDVARLRELVAEGWDPAGSGVAADRARARGDLRVSALPAGGLPAEVDCTTVALDDQPYVNLSRPTWVVMPDGPVQVRTEDAHGRGVQALAAFRAEVWRVRALPGTSTRIGGLPGGEVELCRPTDPGPGAPTDG